MIRAFKSLIVLVVLVAAIPVAFAQQALVDAKVSGAVGERPDGLVAMVGETSDPSIQALIQSVNTQRLSEYQKIATDTDAPLEAVQARAGRQIIQNLPKGQYFMDAAGRWRKK